MLVFKRLAALAVTIGVVLAGAGIALAGDGQPSPWQLGFQQSATPVMDNIVSFHTFVLYIIIAISLFVLVLLLTSWCGSTPAPIRRRRAPPTTPCSRSPGR